MNLHHDAMKVEKRAFDVASGKLLESSALPRSAIAPKRAPRTWKKASVKK